MKADPNFLNFLDLAFAVLGPFIIVVVFGRLYLIYNLEGRNVLSLRGSFRRSDSPLAFELMIYELRNQLTRRERIVLYAQFVSVCVLAICVPATMIIVMWYVGPQLFAKFFG